MIKVYCPLTLINGNYKACSLLGDAKIWNTVDDGDVDDDDDDEYSRFPLNLDALRAALCGY